MSDLIDDVYACPMSKDAAKWFDNKTIEDVNRALNGNISLAEKGALKIRQSKLFLSKKLFDMSSSRWKKLMIVLNNFAKII